MKVRYFDVPDYQLFVAWNLTALNVPIMKSDTFHIISLVIMKPL